MRFALRSVNSVAAVILILITPEWPNRWKMPIISRAASKCSSNIRRRYKRLSAELQLIIWDRAIMSISLRVAEIIGIHHEAWPNGVGPTGTNYYTSPSPIPSLLHACHLSREVALTSWKLSFAFEPQFGSLPSHLAKIFIDFRKDTLFFGARFYSLIHFQSDVNPDD